MNVQLPSKTDLTMYNIHLPNQSREELRSGCALILIQHICIKLRHILVDSKNLEFGLGYDVVMKLCMDILGKIITCIVTTCLHLSRYLRTYWLVKHTAIGVKWKYLPHSICETDRMILGYLQITPGWQLKLGGHCLASKYNW